MPLTSRFCRLCSNESINYSRRYYFFKTSEYGFKSRQSSLKRVNDEVLQIRKKNNKIFQLVSAYREHGHRIAKTNPFSLDQSSFVPELDIDRYSLSPSDKFELNGILTVNATEGSVDQIIELLKKIYCSSISVEFTYLQDENEREWFASNFERLSEQKLDPMIEKRAAIEMLKSQAFDRFLATKFVTLKRYGAEGAESMFAFYVEFFRALSEAKVDEVVIGMAHRGRLNLLTGLLQLPPAKLFHKLAGNSEFPSSAKACGDVISHLTTSINIKEGGHKIHVTSLYNPSHLEAVNPVSMGKTRAKYMSKQQGGYGNGEWGERIINLQVHGDGALMGQGVNQETFLMSQLPFFEVGGSIHLVINNQLAFTTPPYCGRGTHYPTDIAKIISAPVIHVDGSKPELVIKSARLAVDYQRKFRKDIFVDLNCYRRWGHNELDDPTFTNPLLYKIIKDYKSVLEQYADSLLQRGKMTKREIDSTVTEHTAWLGEELRKAESYEPEAEYFHGNWQGFAQADSAITVWDTGVHINLLHHLGKKSVSYPEGFNIHPNVLRSHVQTRLKKVAEQLSLDWATAEALAFGSLLYQGYNIRLSGQDVGRGTFSQRHAMLVDQDTGLVHIPLNNMIEDQKHKLEIVNSLLSEEAVLGYEYGVSIENPRCLVIWEAQFGDFFNGAQIQIDTFITSGEAKWMQCSGLVMLLPHGYDGAGPEHSSCRIERFLQLTDSSENRPDGEDVNFHVANPTTPAQYFHLLRRQMLRNYRKPLVIVGPKILLRLPEATSPLSAMEPGTNFQPVIDDDDWSLDRSKVSRVILTSGKHYYAIKKHMKENNVKETAIVRVEELCPFPTWHLQRELERYSRAKVFIWSQEEPQNMGAWTFVKPRFENLLGRKIVYAGRKPLPVPAVGIGKLYKEEAEFVVRQPFLI
ncbi:hypothetical protein LSTR_LSTR000928 [Laodelphax striatellus]|uniref:Transketolase-like pyrimidine-binding domain-containing protein n=1 Tax=Laodelphax striatellus TaxID=195883 RepID=A0A482X0M5_LAOST|nr:hypothetical protein LSTR_LSTR000928 [Laodelphax striatellus]